MATRERCTNYNNGEGHETYMSDSSDCVIVFDLHFRFIKKKLLCLISEKKRQNGESNFLMSTQLITGRDELKKPRGFS